MNAPNPAQDRAAARTAFARAHLGPDCAEPHPASSDASFRSYWRVGTDAASVVLMDAPPEREDLGPWLDVAARLRAAGLRAPRVLAEDRSQGFLLIEDFGTRTLLPELSDASVEAHYAQAMRAMLQMQAKVDAAGLPDYDADRLVAEMELLPTWFLQRHLGIDPGCDGWDELERAFAALVRAALEQPQVFVHRDFHSRNLMLLDDGELGLIDFQDAVRGPIAYDLVSLLRDCYIVWPEDRVESWCEAYRVQAAAAGLLRADRAGFARWFDLIGLQRHLKVLGIFCRLWYRDGKAGYLADLPRVWDYVRRVGVRHDETRALVARLETAIGARDLSLARA